MMVKSSINKKLTLVLAQLNWTVGDIEGNTDKMLLLVEEQQSSQVDLIVFTELALCGYPPEDLLYRPDFHSRCQFNLERLRLASHKIAIIVGHPDYDQFTQQYFNALSVFEKGELIARYYKQCLPNYGVFDEQRYFTAGKQSCVINFNGYRIGLLICEDLWQPQPINALKGLAVDLIISINASPYEIEKQIARSQLVSSHCQRLELPLIYLNQIGAQDELIFDGNSFVCDQIGNITHSFPQFVEHVMTLTLDDCQLVPTSTTKFSTAGQLAQIYQALVLSVKDYVNKNSFNGVILGLSGGIDSALTLAIATDALGKERVHAVMMPFRYTASMSIEDAALQANILGIRFDIMPIEPIFDSALRQLDTCISTAESKSIMQENLQARCRMLLLMALSNQNGHLVLTTSNKSEIAVGYSTLYGDMAGGFDVLKDIYKTQVVALCHYRNQYSKIIPERVINRPPSAELALNQLDQDSLPEYAILDAILVGYLEQDNSVEMLVSRGFDEEVVRKIIRLVDRNEYKRRQAPIGPKISHRHFGKERRYPITSGFGHKNW